MDIAAQGIKVMAIGTLSLDIVIVAALLLFVFGRKSVFYKKRIALAGEYAVGGLFLTLVAAVVGTMFIENVAGFLPCMLCWWQRIFLFPQIVLFAVALVKQDKNIADYSIALSVCGAIVALYQHYLQFGGSALVPCDASGACAVRQVLEFGYITIPFMAFTMFAFIIVTMIAFKLAKKSS